MTEKHFKFVAELLTDVPFLQLRKELANKACKMFKAENPKFNKAKFLEACGLTP